MIKFDDQFNVSATPSDVMALLSDIECVISCVPGATLQGRDDNGDYLASMTVAFGPKRVNFSGRFNCTFDSANRTGLIVGGGTAPGRSANVQVKTQFAVLPAQISGEANSSSIVKVDSEAKMHGVLAQFAATGGVTLAKQLMRDFAANLADKIDLPTENQAASRPVKPLTIWSILTHTLRDTCGRIAKTVGSKFGSGDVK